MNQPGQNPYIGPRPFLREEKDKFFGREREGRDLLSLVSSERLLLFYAQSGAGKTSLINTRLVPGLEAKHFEVLPIGRVSGELLPGVEVDNIFATNLMLKLDMGADEPLRFKGLRLAQFLGNLAFDGKEFIYHPPTDPSTSTPPAKHKEQEFSQGTGDYQVLPRVLIIDQFEELFTTHPEAWKKREDFLQQLADAMAEDPYLWVVLSMREDHIAGLDPYASMLPGGLRVRYYMQRLTVDAALEAVTQPVASIRPFEPQAAKELVENLSQISAGHKESDKAHFVPGEFVEPVQLQVVCYQLWEEIKGLPGDKVTLNDLHRLARGQDLAIFVNQALADFYEASLQKALRQSKAGVSEKKLRAWFANQLITEAKTRGFAFMGDNTTGGIPNEIVMLLEGQLLRGESRAGGRWYELVHDRFIDPILQSNQGWENAQQRKTRFLAIGVASIAFIFFLLLAGVINQSQTEAARADNALSAVQNSRVTANTIFGDSVNTLSALEAASTEKAVQAQLIMFTAEAAYATIANFELTSPASAKFTQTATPTPRGTALTPAPTNNILATEQNVASAATLQSQLDAIKVTQTALASPIRELIIGQTARGTQIWAAQLGTGTRNIVLVGGLHAGFAPATVEIAEYIANYYKSRLDQIPAEVKLHIITNANPDSPFAPGEISGRLNSSGTDLNRNWDCEWRQNATWGSQTISGGSQPFSELETQVLREYFLRIQPVGVVFWEARAAGGMAAPGGCGQQSLFSESLAQIYGSAAGYKVAKFEAYAVNGDATNWLDAQGIPAISVLLPDYSNPDPENNLKAVQELLKIYRQ